MKHQQSIKDTDEVSRNHVSGWSGAMFCLLCTMFLDFVILWFCRKNAFFPKIEDTSGILFFYFIPFHAMLVWAWTDVVNGYRSPVVYDSHKQVRIRLVQRRPLASAMVVCGLGAILIFFVGGYTLGLGVPPLIVNAAGLGLLLALVGIAWFARWMPIRAGQADLIFDRENNTVQLPLTFGRKQRCRVDLNRLQIGINPSLRSWENGDFTVYEVVANVYEVDDVPKAEVLAVRVTLRQAERIAKAIRANLQVE